MNLVAQPSRLRVRAASRRATEPEHEARRPVNPLARTPALQSLARFRGSKREIQFERSLSRREREQHLTVLLCSGVFRAISDSRILQDLRKILPLPAGGLG